MPYLSPEELLAFWETAHGKLKKEWQVLFLAKPQITQILQFTSDQVIPAVRSHEKLSEILIELQARENKALDIKPPLNRVVENEPANEWRKNKIHLLERLNFYYLLRAKVRAILFFTLMLTHSRSISGL